MPLTACLYIHLSVTRIRFFLLITVLQFFSFFFFNDTATTEIYTLSLHDALPISFPSHATPRCATHFSDRAALVCRCRSEEHTSELQSPCNLVCRLLLEKKKNKRTHVWLCMT